MNLETIALLDVLVNMNIISSYEGELDNLILTLPDGRKITIQIYT
jgi:hypothetical protein